MASPPKPATATSLNSSLRNLGHRSFTTTPGNQHVVTRQSVKCAVLNVKLTTEFSNTTAAGKYIQQVDQRIIRDIVKNGSTKDRLKKLAQAMGVFKACINVQKGTLSLVFVDLDVLEWFWAEHDQDAVATVLTDILVNEGVNESGREVMVRAAVDPAEFRSARRLLAGTETSAEVIPDWPIRNHVTRCLTLEAGTKRALEDSELCERLIQMTHAQHGPKHTQKEGATLG